MNSTDRLIQILKEKAVNILGFLMMPDIQHYAEIKSENLRNKE